MVIDVVVFVVIDNVVVIVVVITITIVITAVFARMWFLVILHRISHGRRYGSNTLGCISPI